MTAWSISSLLAVFFLDIHDPRVDCSRWTFRHLTESLTVLMGSSADSPDHILNMARDACTVFYCAASWRCTVPDILFQIVASLPHHKSVIWKLLWFYSQDLSWTFISNAFNLNVSSFFLIVQLSHPFVASWNYSQTRVLKNLIFVPTI